MTNSNPSSTTPSPLPKEEAGAPAGRRPFGIALFFTGLFAFLGFADSAYLTADHFFALPVPCGLTGGCDTVLTSAYATIGPVPIALFGAGYYLLALFLAVYIYTSPQPSRALAAGRLVWLLSAVGLLVSAVLVYIQAGVLQAFCLYCLGSAITSCLLFISASFLFRSLRGYRQGK